MRAIADLARLDRMFFALDDVHRRGMLDRLSRGPASVTELAEPPGILLPSAVKHLAVLEQGGFVASQKLGRAHLHTAQPRRWMRWKPGLPGAQDAAQRAQFDWLDAYLAEQQGKATMKHHTECTHTNFVIERAFRRHAAGSLPQAWADPQARWRRGPTAMPSTLIRVPILTSVRSGAGRTEVVHPDGRVQQIEKVFFDIVDARRIVFTV